MLTLNNITYRIAGRTLLDQASVSISTGCHVGLVGPNGVGKSTLFRLIANEIELDGGKIMMRSGTRMGMVCQDLPQDDTSLLDVVLATDTECASLLKEAETATDPGRISDIYLRLNDIDAYTAMIPSQASVHLIKLMTSI